MKKIIFLCLFFCITNFVGAQTILSGKVTDASNGETIISATLGIFQNDIFITGGVTDVDGRYQIELPAGTYDVTVDNLVFTVTKITGVIVEDNKTTLLDIQLTPKDDLLIYNFGPDIFYPFVILSETTTGSIIRTDEVEKLPTKDIREMSTMTPGVTFERN